MKSIILAAPNTASTTLVDIINKNTNYTSFQIVTYPNTSSIIQKKILYSYLKNLKIKKCLKMIFGYYFHSIINDYLRMNKLRVTNPTKDFHILSNFHSDICDFDLRLFLDFEKFIFNQKKLILKQHFPPTNNNLKFFKNFKKVILIRDTDSIIKKYSQIDPKLYQFINEDILKLEVNTWKSKWMSEKETLIVNFDELINNTYKQLKIIQEYTGIQFNIPETFAIPHLNKTQKKTFNKEN